MDNGRNEKENELTSDADPGARAPSAPDARRPRAYRPPTLRYLGSVRELTLASTTKPGSTQDSGARPRK